MEHDRILGYFLEEASEHLNTIEQGLRKLPETVKQPTMIRELFRAAHSIKGSAAMLGLTDVQQVSNQFEANFKLLKEQPQIEVDKQLQSLFLESFGFLRAGINEVRTSSDPYRQDPNTPDPIGDPVFEELKSYLKHLLTITEPIPVAPTNSEPSRDPSLEQIFGEYVTTKLDLIISLCLQPDRSETRTQIQQICQKLGNLGANFEYLEWTNLFAACRLAIANPANPLPQLGESISVAVKQAQILVLADRHQSIGITPDLEALIGNHHSRQSTAGNLSTWQLDDFANLDLDNTQKIVGRDDIEVTLPQQQFVGLSSINQRVQPFSNNLADPFNSSELGFDADAVELNEFMNLLSDDMPTGGTWMQDDDFFDHELPLKSLSELIVPSTVLPLDDLSTDEPKIIATGYDEETFYTPELNDLNDQDMATFWSDDRSAELQQQPLYSDLDLHTPDRQFKPNLSPLDFDAAAPDFSLDHPMSDLFSTVAAPEDWADLAPEQLNFDQLEVPDLEAARLENTIPLDDPFGDGFTEIESPLEPNQFQPDLQLPLAFLDHVNPVTVTEQLTDSLDLSDITNDLNSSISDILLFEELTSSKSPGLDVEDHQVNHQPIAQSSDELEDWIENTIGDYEVDKLEELDLDTLDRMEAEIQSTNDDNFADLDFDAFMSTSSVVDPSVGDDFDSLELDSIDNNLAPSSSDPVTSTDLHPQNIDRLDLDPATTNAFADLDIFANTDTESDLLNDPISASAISDNVTDLDLDRLPLVNFEDLPEVDFDLNNLRSDLDNHNSIDLDNILLDLPDSNLAEIGDLESLFSEEDLDIETMILPESSSAFDDLDALMGTPTPVANLDDLDDLLGGAALINNSLIAAATPTINPPENNAKPKSTDRRAKQSRTFEQTMRVSVRHLDNLNNLVGELVVNRNTLEQDQTRMRQFVEKLLSEVQKLNEVGKRMQDLYERSLMENSLVASRQQHKPTTPTPQIIGNEDLGGSNSSIEYDPLEMDRFTPIHLLSQKMIELTVRVRESTADIEFVVDGSTEVTRTLRQITGQLQEDLTKSRMVPFAQTADRLQRGVRDNGLKYGKQVELSVEGRDTLIDKVILESLTDPLIHMVNNAIAHGIETGETRLGNGKSIDGKITIRALHQGNQTIISISDDGAGIDTERVKAKAIEKGLITAQHAATMPNTEVYELLFLPSFSTKDQADELAGRGVGMDVVRTSLTEIRGTITTESQLGVGTTFTIRLPLALSIAKALIAVNNKCNIAFPMDGIEDTQDISPEQIQLNSDGEQCIFWRDELMPFKPLSDLLGFNRPLARNNFYTTNEDDSDLVSILILRSDGNLIAVQVDKITGDQEIVIKPLQGPAAKPLGIAGATVMGDGRIIPIADVMELIALAKGTLSRHISTEWTAQMAAPTVEVRESMVLIVDDSITVRELLSLTFKRAGYRVEQARDGQEAWDKLRAGLPCDIVFCDIEMPRMDGLEFLSRVQKDVALSKVPVAMLTSRGSDRHRQIAAQLGASGYFIKPYLEEALLDAAKRMIKGEVLQIV